MKKTVSLFLIILLAGFLADPSSLAQRPGAETAATNSIQESPAPVTADTPQPRIRKVNVPAGTPVDIEATYSVSSRDMRPGDLLSFRVLVPIKIDGLIVIDASSLVTGRVVKAKRGGHWGKAGKLAWTMQDVVAVDLTRVPLTVQELAGHESEIAGTSHGGEVAARTIVFGALLFPASPLALMSGFKRGEDAVLPQGKRFVVYVQRETEIKISLSPP